MFPSHDRGGNEGTVAAILQSITGLGVGPGSLQKMITEASPQGLLATGKDLLEGKIGALSAAGIQGAIEQTVNSVLAEFEQTVTDGINNGLIGSINKTVNNITGYDTDGSGNLVLLRDSATTGNMPDALTEFNTAIQKVKDKPFSDIQSIVTEAKEIKQNLEGAKSDFENLTGKNGDEVLRSVQENSSSRAKYNRITDESRTLIKTRNAN